MSQKDIITVLNPPRAMTDDVSCTADQMCTARFNAIFSQGENERHVITYCTFTERCIITYYSFNE